MVLNESRPDMDRHARRRGAASALTTATATTISCRKDRRRPSLFLPRCPEAVHTLTKMQGINCAHGKFSFRIAACTNGAPLFVSLSEVRTFEKRTPLATG